MLLKCCLQLLTQGLVGTGANPLMTIGPRGAGETSLVWGWLSHHMDMVRKGVWWSGMASCLDLGSLGAAGAQQAAGPAESTAPSHTDHQAAIAA